MGVIMLSEKEMEDAIAANPEKYLGEGGMKLIGRQYRIGNYIFDLLFEDKYGARVIVEIQKGTLDRNHTYKILDYYHEYKENNPLEFIELMVVANKVPDERRRRLNDWGVSFKEIPIDMFAQEKPGSVSIPNSIVQRRSEDPSRKQDLVTAFFEKLRNALRDDVRLQDKPTKNSRWAGTFGRIRNYRFWYDNGPWDNKGMSYMIDLYSNESRDDLKNKFCVHLGISKEHLLNKGVSELALSGLFDTLCKHNNIYKVYKARDMIYAEKWLDMIEMDENEMLKVKGVLIELINNTKPAIDDICCI